MTPSEIYQLRNDIKYDLIGIVNSNPGMDPKQLNEFVYRKLQDIICDKLTTRLPERLVRLAHHLFKLERSLSKEHSLAMNKLIQLDSTYELEYDYVSSIIDDIERQLLHASKWLEEKYPDPMTVGLEVDLFADFQMPSPPTGELLSTAEHCERVLDCQRMLFLDLSVDMRGTLESKLKETSGTTILQFNQGDFDTGETLNGGICHGLNVDIVVQRQKTPRHVWDDVSSLIPSKRKAITADATGTSEKMSSLTKALVSLKGKDGKDITAEELRALRLQDLGRGELSPRARFLQSAYGLSLDFTPRPGPSVSKPVREIPKRVLQQMGVKCETIYNTAVTTGSSERWSIAKPARVFSSQDTILSSEEFVDAINMQQDLLIKSQGLVVLKLVSLEKNFAHAISIEINHSKSSYAIIDINHGVITFPNYEAFKKGLDVYIKTKYHKKNYNLSIRAEIFYPEEPSVSAGAPKRKMRTLPPTPTRETEALKRKTRSLPAIPVSKTRPRR